MIEIIVYVVIGIITGSIMLWCMLDTVDLEDMEAEWITVFIAALFWPVVLSIIILIFTVAIAAIILSSVYERLHK